jgi:hypothetical protein
MSKQKEKPSTLKREHPALKNMKYLAFFYFSGSFWPSWIRIHWPDWIRIRIRNTDTDTCIIHVHRYVTFWRYPKRGSKSGDLAASRIGFTAENKTNKNFQMCYFDASSVCCTMDMYCTSYFCFVGLSCIQDMCLYDIMSSSICHIFTWPCTKYSIPYPNPL